MNNFITNIIDNDIKNGLTNVKLRFPPEPNGYLHLGHVKSILLHDALSEKYGAELNLRFDDTNPKKENTDYVNAIEEDAKWLSSRFTRVVYASDYFNTMCECAYHLIRKGLAYVDLSTPDELKALRGDFNHVGENSKYRDNTIKENENLFEKMKTGFFKENEAVLRAKIDMASPNLNLRDPVIYRISNTEHHRTGNKWNIYPMYDFAHPISDAIECITHSLCTLEFEDHKPLYDWIVDNCYDLLKCKPRQIEFSRLEIDGITLSKRKLNELVINNKVSGWDDPAMPTIRGLRNRGVTVEILKDLINKVGVSKSNVTVEYEALNKSVCDVLGPNVERRIAITKPSVLYIANLNTTIECNLSNHPKIDLGLRKKILTSKVLIDSADVRLEATPDFWRIAPGNTVRLKNGLNIFVNSVELNEDGSFTIRADADLESIIMKNAKVKAKSTIHWLNPMDSIAYKTIRYEKNTSKIEDAWYLEKEVSDGYYEFERIGYVFKKGDLVNVLAFIKK